MPHLPTGKLRALAITTAQRSPLAPDVPTMQEAGVPGYETQSLYGLFAPARTPPDIVKKIHADLTEIAMRPDVRSLLAARSFEVQGKTAMEFQKIIDSDTAKVAARDHDCEDQGRIGGRVIEASGCSLCLQITDTCVSPDSEAYRGSEQTPLRTGVGLDRTGGILSKAGTSPRAPA